MRLLLVVGVVVGGYVYFLLHTTNIVLDQTQKLNASYQNVANNVDKIAGVKN